MAAAEALLSERLRAARAGGARAAVADGVVYVLDAAVMVLMLQWQRQQQQAQPLPRQQLPRAGVNQQTSTSRRQPAAVRRASAGQSARTWPPMAAAAAGGASAAAPTAATVTKGAPGSVVNQQASTSRRQPCSAAGCPPKASRQCGSRVRNHQCARRMWANCGDPRAKKGRIVDPALL